jgi:predicted amidohydrolase
MDHALRVAACQTPEILGDPDAAIACIRDFAARTASSHPDLLLFPECFLQGYLVEKHHLQRHALSTASRNFKAILDQLADLHPTLVFGFIETLDGKYYNSAAIVNHGHLEGVYRKTHLTAGETRLFNPGASFPIFTLKNIRFGLNICYDTQFPDAAAQVARQGAQLLLVPAQNMMRRENVEKWRHRHNKIRLQRVKETGLWLISSDVSGTRDSGHIAYGPTAAIHPSLGVIAQAPLMQPGFIVVDIAPTPKLGILDT